MLGTHCDDGIRYHINSIANLSDQTARVTCGLNIILIRVLSNSYYGRFSESVLSKKRRNAFESCHGLFVSHHALRTHASVTTRKKQCAAKRLVRTSSSSSSKNLWSPTKWITAVPSRGVWTTPRRTVRHHTDNVSFLRQLLQFLLSNLY